MAEVKVNQPSQHHIDMMSLIDLPAALMGGTVGMRAKGRTYLPQFPSESDDAYDARLKSTFLYNEFEKTVNRLAGLPFTTDIKLENDVPAKMKPWLDDADLMGNDFTTFARDVFRTALVEGITFILVDYPKTSGKLTLAQERDQQIRPYLVHVRMEQLIGFQAERVGGKWVITQIRLSEIVAKPAGRFGTEAVEQIRVIEPNLVEVYVHDVQRDLWILDEEQSGPTTMDKVTIVPVYAGRTGFLKAKPLLHDLAMKNQEHWQSSSDQRNILHIARVPILFLRCVIPEGGKLDIGARNGIASNDPNALAQWIEVSGASIAAGRQDLLDLEDQMRRIAGEVIVRMAQNVTAEEVDQSSSQNGATLEALVRDYTDALETALDYMAQWAKLGDDGGKVTITLEWKNLGLDVNELQFLLQAAVAEKITDETWLWNLKQAGKLPPDADIAVELQRLKELREAATPDMIEPPPTKRTVNIQRDAQGRAVGFSEE